ncbi:MAG: response regulator transcription factor [Calditrichia bacterium]
MQKKIGIVEDEEDIRSLVDITLKNSGYDTETFSRGAELFDYLHNNDLDLLVLDLMLPDMDGFDICKTIRSDSEHNNLPIIMLTAKNQEMDKILGLEFGADDYMTKPFSPGELVARIKAVLRRVASMETEESSIIRIHEQVEIHKDKHIVTIEGKMVTMTATEFKILTILASRPGRVYTRDELLELLWGEQKYVVDRTIDVHVRHIRKKLGSYSYFIKSIKGVGYKLDIT